LGGGMIFDLLLASESLRAFGLLSVSDSDRQRTDGRGEYGGFPGRIKSNIFPGNLGLLETRIGREKWETV